MINIGLVLLILVGSSIGYNISKLVDKVILWKQKQNYKEYRVYRVEYIWDKWINAVLVCVAIAISFIYFGFYKFIITSIMFILAVFGSRLDERIRIIPNELVLLIFVIGIVNRLIIGGFVSLVYGFASLFIVAGIFFLSGLITKLLSGSIGIGAGDIKLAMAIALSLGIEHIFLFLAAIVLFLIMYIAFGFFTKTMSVGSSFPMCTQIMGGFVIVMYKPFVVDFIKVFSNYIR